MAKVEKNVLTRGLSGKLGNQVVFRRRGAETLMTVAPGRRTSPQTDAQLEHQQQFREAVIYAKAAMADPVLNGEYGAAAKSGESGFNLAVADYLKGPEIVELDQGLYTGEVGSKIRIRATDNFKVTAVMVKIHKADNTVLESGNAIAGSNGLDWDYTATLHNDAMPGGKIVAIATDTPGHQVEMTMML